MLAERMMRVTESGTMRMAAETINLKSRGIEIINLGVGEPDFNTPEFVKKAAKKAIDENKSRYTLAKGLKELREAIALRLKADFDVLFSPDEIIVTNGAKQAIFNVILALIDQGDEILVPSPCWPTYIEHVHIAGGRPVLIHTNLESGFKITPDQLKKAITSKTKAIIFSNPGNPTGMVYDGDELTALMQVLIDKNIYVLSDEIYGKLIYEKCRFLSAGKFRETLNDHVIIFQGASKAYAMTGWRLGYAAGPLDIIKACDIIQGHSTSNASTISQYAALAAFNGPQDEVNSMCWAFSERRRFVLNFLKKIDDISFAEPYGAFYVFPEIRKYYGFAPDGSEIKNSTDLAFYLLNNAHVSVVPGKGFGAEGFLRISYATGMEQLNEGLNALKNALYKIKR